MTPIQIKKLRRRTGLTQRDFAEQLGCALDSLRRWEQGRSTPSRAWTMQLDNLKAGLDAMDKREAVA